MTPQLGLVIVVIVVALLNVVLCGAAGLALSRVIRAAARDAYSSPRRRLLALDDGFARSRPRGIAAVLCACRPWTTQKALLAMVTFTAALRIAWAFIAARVWNSKTGVVAQDVGEVLRGVFYGLDFFQAASAFTLYTIMARFWAELATSARNGSGGSRSRVGNEDMSSLPPVIWEMTRGAQRAASAISFGAAAFATVLKATAWGIQPTYMNVWTAFVEAAAYMIASFVMIAAAYCAVVELRLVPIELPTRRRRVCRVIAVTGSITVCLLVRSVILIWLANRDVEVTNGWELVYIVAYMGLLDALPLAIVLLYNRVTPMSTWAPTRERSRRESRMRRPPEEVPLISGTSGRIGTHAIPDNPFVADRGVTEA